VNKNDIRLLTCNNLYLSNKLQGLGLVTSIYYRDPISTHKKEKRSLKCLKETVVLWQQGSEKREFGIKAAQKVPSFKIL